MLHWLRARLNPACHAPAAFEGDHPPLLPPPRRGGLWARWRGRRAEAAEAELPESPGTEPDEHDPPAAPGRQRFAVV
ncbi:hypothetical protein Q8F55_008216 [Vanrija albida]|uniref:Uncharacterized protein n=1 Tax=Vanrija albida TaxID=181172 RepID=A0ABR3PVM7_9TREE